MSRLKHFWQANREGFFYIICILLVAGIFFGGIIAICVSEANKVYVNYVGEITNMQVKFDEENCEEQFLITIRLDTGDERILKVDSNPQATSFYFTLDVGKRYEFNVLLVNEPNLDYHGTLNNLIEFQQEEVIYESIN